MLSLPGVLFANAGTLDATVSYPSLTRIELCVQALCCSKACSLMEWSTWLHDRLKELMWLRYLSSRGPCKFCVDDAKGALQRLRICLSAAGEKGLGRVRRSFAAGYRLTLCSAHLGGAHES